MFDLNDTEPMRASEALPDGTFAKVTMTIRPGSVDGAEPIDRGLLKRSNSVGSDVLQLDCEFVVSEGPFARRKFWHPFTVSGGKVDENGVSVGWNISKRMFRAMIDSALGLDSQDMSDTAKARRHLRGLADLSGITFVAKIMTEQNEGYSPRNKLERPVLPNEPEWRAVMDGKVVPAAPTLRKTKGNQATTDNNQPAWQQAPGAAQPSPAPAPAPAPAAGYAPWRPGSAVATPAPAVAAPAPAWAQQAATPVPTPAAAPTAPPAAMAGPAWLNG